MNEKEEYFRVGIITEAHGVRGEVKVFLTTDDVPHLKKVKEFHSPCKDGMEILHPEGMKQTKDRIILKFREINDRDTAERYRKRELYVDRAHAVPLEEDEYYISDLEGLEVYEDDRFVGTVKDVLQTGANDVYVIEKTEGGELLLPAIRQCVLKVDVAGGRMDVKVMEGL
ncbi:MAG: 16S rRNA processing protein RimM [Lachnospiraceae bacterium]|nr:16S rRNA processing protein RimM [Lachnospiraceae bacterium]